MSFIENLYSKFVISNIKETDTEPNVDEWLSFLDNLPAPKNYIEASYNKYKCRCFHFPKYKVLALNIASFPGAIKSLFGVIGDKKKLVPPIKGKAIIESKKDVDYRDIVPDDLYRQFSSIEVVMDSRITGDIKEADYCFEAKKLFIEVAKRHPFSFYYLFWISRELKKHSQYLANHGIEAIAVYIEERNIASPVLKKLYETNDRKYISFMHGEYLLRLIQGYMAFSQYYIWDNMYRRVFAETLRCDIGEYTLYKPLKLTKKWDFEGIIPEYFCTYYFSAESKESINKLGKIIEDLRQKGKKCKVRPHPRYSQLDVINEVFPQEIIENPKNVSIEESLRNTKYVVGLATTVLSEAYFEGKEIVIDDLSSPEKFNNLEKRNYICLRREHRLLSEIINQD